MAKNLDLGNTIKSLIQIIYIIIITYVAYQIIKVLFGGTWTTENIILAGLGIILSGMFAIVGFLINQAKCLGKIEERTENIGKSLINLGNDFKAHINKKKH